MASWPHGDPSAVVRDILASAPYRHASVTTSASPKPSAAQMILDWLGHHVVEPILHWLRGHMGHAFGGAGASTAGTIIVYAIVAFAVAVLVLAIYRLVVAFAGSRDRDARAAGDRVALASVPSSAQWRARAAEAARHGEYARAIAALFTAALATLDERALVAFDATRTPGEYRRLVRRTRAAAAEPFNDLAGLFVHAAYAEVVTTADDYVRAERAYATFEPTTASA